METLKKLLKSNNWEDTILALIIGKDKLTDDQFHELFGRIWFPKDWRGAADHKYRMIQKGNSWYVLGPDHHKSLWKSEYPPNEYDIIL